MNKDFKDINEVVNHLDTRTLALETFTITKNNFALIDLLFNTLVIYFKIQRQEMGLSYLQKQLKIYHEDGVLDDKAYRRYARALRNLRKDVTKLEKEEEDVGVPEATQSGTADDGSAF